MVEHALREIEIVGRDHDDGAGLFQQREPRGKRRRRRVVQPRERLVEQQEARAMNQRALEGDALPHPA